jgi:multiple sugar transport system substrate-binding protein
MTKFQIIILILFVVFTIAGLLLFSLGSHGKAPPINIAIWGTINKTQMTQFIDQVIKTGNDKNITITYTEFSRDNVYNQLVEALALDRGPDAILITQDMLMQTSNKLIGVPYANYPAANFKNTFIAESGLYLDANGVVGFPFSIDPLVMYWNRDLFTNAGIAEAPVNWENFLKIVPKLTVRDAAQNINQSAVALGEYANINYAKDILSMLIMQAGNPIVVRSANGGAQTVLGERLNQKIYPADAALTFYTQFANSVKQVYTWNRSLDNSKVLFTGNKLAIYFGYASEYADIKAKNPYLNFNVAVVPQAETSSDTPSAKLTFGRMYGFSIVRGTRNAANTVAALNYLTSKSSLDIWSHMTGLPSPRLDSLRPDPKSAESAVFSTSALWSRGWLEPTRADTERIFKEMIEGVTSRRKTNERAIGDAVSQLNRIVR